MLLCRCSGCWLTITSSTAKEFWHGACSCINSVSQLKTAFCQVIVCATVVQPTTVYLICPSCSNSQHFPTHPTLTLALYHLDNYKIFQLWDLPTSSGTSAKSSQIHHKFPIFFPQNSLKLPQLHKNLAPTTRSRFNMLQRVSTTTWPILPALRWDVRQFVHWLSINNSTVPLNWTLANSGASYSPNQRRG